MAFSGYVNRKIFVDLAQVYNTPQLDLAQDNLLLFVICTVAYDLQLDLPQILPQSIAFMFHCLQTPLIAVEFPNLTHDLSQLNQFWSGQCQPRLSAQYSPKRSVIELLRDYDYFSPFGVQN